MLFVENMGSLKEILEDIHRAHKIYLTKINVKKTKSMFIGKIGEQLQFTLENEKIKQVEVFRYLESLGRENMVCTKEVKLRLAITKNAFNRNICHLLIKMGLELNRLEKYMVWSP